MFLDPLLRDQMAGVMGYPMTSLRALNWDFSPFIHPKNSSLWTQHFKEVSIAGYETSTDSYNEGVFFFHPQFSTIQESIRKPPPKIIRCPGGSERFVQQLCHAFGQYYAGSRGGGLNRPLFIGKSGGDGPQISYQKKMSCSCEKHVQLFFLVGNFQTMLFGRFWGFVGQICVG